MRSDKRPLTFVQTASYCQISISMYDVRFHAPIVIPTPFVIPAKAGI